MNDVHKITIEVAKPRGSFAGRVEIGYYCVADGHVVLTDENGKPIGDAKRHLNPGDDARLIACASCGQIGVLGAQYRDLVRRSRTPRAGKTFDMCRGGLVRALAGKGPRSGRMYAECGP